MLYLFFLSVFAGLLNFACANRKLPTGYFAVWPFFIIIRTPIFIRPPSMVQDLVRESFPLL